MTCLPPAPRRPLQHQHLRRHLRLPLTSHVRHFNYFPKSYFILYFFVVDASEVKVLTSVTKDRPKVGGSRRPPSKRVKETSRPALEGVFDEDDFGDQAPAVAPAVKAVAPAPVPAAVPAPVVAVAAPAPVPAAKAPAAPVDIFDDEPTITISAAPKAKKPKKKKEAVVDDVDIFA